MPGVLILCAHRPGRSPSQRYRFEQYLPFLEKQGYSFTFSYLLNKTDDSLFYSNGNSLRKALILFKSVLIRFKDLRRFKHYDYVFIQREALFLGTSFFEKHAFKSGARVIFDFDDSIWLADTSPGNKKWEWIKKPSKFFTNVTYAHTVIAGNNYLAEQARPFNSNTVVIPTTIDTDIHVPRPFLRNTATTVIGWSGSISTVKHFELLLPVFKQLKEKYEDKIQFKLLGNSAYKNTFLDIEALAWSELSEVDKLNTFDIGVMPLPDDEWAKGKCGLKALSYMACGIPVVISPVGINTLIVQQGENGFLANNTQQWLHYLSQLIEHPDLRLQLGEAGRKTVIEKYSVEANKQNYLKVFKSLVTTT